MAGKMQHQAYKQKCGGMAMLSVLFIVIAIVVISMGYLHRSDMALACGHNMAQRTQSDYLAWAGLEHARAMVQATEPNAPLGAWSSSGLQLEVGSNLYYDLSIGDPNLTAGIYTYPFACEAYVLSGAAKQARSFLEGRIVYDPNDGKATFAQIDRQ